ncbi:MAG: hypothetical protein ACXAES_07380 [Promethearchaeota archaeon]
MKENFLLMEKINYHFTQTFTEFRLVINNLPEDLWRRPPPGKKEWDLMKPSLLAFHTIFTLTLRHMFNLPGLRRKFNFDTKTVEITKEIILQMMDEIEENFLAKYGKLTNEALLTNISNDKFTAIDQMVYVLGHFRYHMGELVQIGKENGIEEPKWYPLEYRDAMKKATIKK